MTLKEYFIGTCLGCKKCLYCGDELSIRKRMCSCDKTIKPSKKNRTDKVKVAYSRVFTPNLSSKQCEYIKSTVTRFNYSLDLSTKFNFTLCSSCHSYFQRQKKSVTTNDSSNPLENNDDCIILDESDDDTKHEFEVDEKSETKQITISFNLIIKSSTGPSLPSKWLKVEASSLDDVLADVHHYVGKLTGDKGIMHSDYSLSFKPEKSGGVGAQLEDMQDYKKFLLDYQKLVDKKKNMSIIAFLKKKKEKRKVILLFVSFIQKTIFYFICIYLIAHLLMIMHFYFFRKFQILKNLKVKISNCIKKKMQYQN